MAENEDGTERTEQPTEKRLRDAREKGDIPHSRELANAAVFTAGVFALVVLAGDIAAGAREWMKAALHPEPSLIQAPALLFGHFGRLLMQLLWVVAPLALICLLAAIAAQALGSGLRFSAQALNLDLNRLNPLSGFKRLYGAEAIAELSKSMLRVLLVGLSTGLCLWQGIHDLRGLLSFPLERAMAEGLSFAMRLLLYAALALGLLAALDTPYQRWRWRHRLKMTREEVRREIKESEGSAEVKGRIRQLQLQISQRRMIEAVPKADVVLVNPTHYAVALQYEGGKMRAPIVVAKGVDEVAQRIRAVGEQHRVAIVSAPPLARALYREARLGKEIPVRLYSAVAQVLSYVYQLRGWRSGPMPPPPQIDIDERADKVSRQ